MIYILENEKLKISANTHGGELNSIFNKINSTEYLWDGNPAGWKYHAPVLFPIVGKVVDSKYRINNEVYELPQHGLGRISEFKMINKTDNSIVFQLKYSEETLKIYPFKFELNCKYTLINNELEVKYEVDNLDSKDIYFSIGSHPAFMCPIDKKDTIEDCYLEFNEKESTSIIPLTKDGYLDKKKKPYLNDVITLKLHKDTFKNDALIFSNLKSNKVTIKSNNNDKSISVDFSGFPYLGIWAPKNGAELLCIEPWFGHADYYDFNGDFSQKEGIIKLLKDKKFECSYKISIK